LTKGLAGATKEEGNRLFSQLLALSILGGGMSWTGETFSKRELQPLPA